MSAAVSSAAPVSAAGSSTRAGSEPTARRTRCGATSPMNPIEPATATAAPTPSATPITTISRVRPMIDAERGGGVLAERQRAERARVQREQHPARDAGTARDQQSDRMLRSSSEPSSQNAISSAA